MTLTSGLIVVGAVVVVGVVVVVVGLGVVVVVVVVVVGLGVVVVVVVVVVVEVVGFKHTKFGLGSTVKQIVLIIKVLCYYH